MTRSDLIRYEGLTVMLRYKGKDSFEHTRTGVVYSVTMERIVFWPLCDDEESIEIRIPLSDVKDVKPLLTHDN